MPCIILAYVQHNIQNAKTVCFIYCWQLTARSLPHCYHIFACINLLKIYIHGVPELFHDNSVIILFFRCLFLKVTIMQLLFTALLLIG